MNNVIKTAILAFSIIPATCRGMDIFDAAQSNNIDSFKEFIKTNAHVNLQDQAGRTPLYIAAACGNSDTINVLIAAGALIDLPDKNGLTPLLAALKGNRQAIIPLLLGAKANINMPDNFGWTPLHEAVISKNRELVQFLIDSGAHVDTCDNDGRAPLHIAFIGNDIETVRILINANVTVTMQDINKAKATQDPKMLELLCNYYQSIEQAQKKTRKSMLMMAQALHIRLGDKSPVALVGTDILEAIGHSVLQAEKTNMYHPKTATRHQGCIIL